MMELVGCVPTCEWDLMALEMSASVMPSTEEARSGWPHSCTASGCRLSVHSLDRLLNRRRGLWCNPWAGTELGQRKDRRKPTGGRQPARTVLSPSWTGEPPKSPLERNQRPGGQKGIWGTACTARAWPQPGAHHLSTLTVAPRRLASSPALLPLLMGQRQEVQRREKACLGETGGGGGPRHWLKAPPCSSPLPPRACC